MELPKFERSVLRAGKEAGIDNKVWFPEWNCFCCHDYGTVRPLLVQKVIPDHNSKLDKAVVCQRCDAGGLLTGEHYDQRFTRAICNQLAEIERQNWVDFAKGQQRSLNLDRLAKSMSMSGIQNRTANDEREIQIRKAEIETKETMV